jgi:RNA recognition motif-containing protein
MREKKRLKKLYVGNLPFSATDSEVEALFAPHGTVASVALITDRETGRPRGFGFVEMQDDAAADKAIASLDGHEMNGRALRVNPAEDKPGGGNRGPRRERW